MSLFTHFTLQALHITLFTYYSIYIFCCNLAKIFLPTPSHLVYIEQLVINVSSSCSTYCRNDDDGISSPPKFLVKFL